VGSAALLPPKLLDACARRHTRGSQRRAPARGQCCPPRFCDFAKSHICGNPGEGCETDENDPTRIFSSPAVSGGRIFIGHTADGAAGYRGGFEAVDAASSKVVWRFETDPKLNFKGQPIGGINRGCGSVWSSAAVDPDPNAHLVYFGTGDCGQDAPPPYHEADGSAIRRPSPEQRPHAARTHRHDLVVETRETPWIVGDQFRIEGSLTVARNPDVELRGLGDYPATIMPAGCGSNPPGSGPGLGRTTGPVVGTGEPRKGGS
jgi:hypothetical protein